MAGKGYIETLERTSQRPYWMIVLGVLGVLLVLGLVIRPACGVGASTTINEPSAPR